METPQPDRPESLPALKVRERYGRGEYAYHDCEVLYTTPAGKMDVRFTNRNGLTRTMRFSPNGRPFPDNNLSNIEYLLKEIS